MQKNATIAGLVLIACGVVSAAWVSAQVSKDKRIASDVAALNDELGAYYRSIGQEHEPLPAMNTEKQTSEWYALAAILGVAGLSCCVYAFRSKSQPAVNAPVP